jgi:hypothetical protein
MLFRRPLHRRDSVPAVMTDQMHHTRAVEIAPFAIGGIVRIRKGEPKHVSISLHPHCDNFVSSTLTTSPKLSLAVRKPA